MKEDTIKNQRAVQGDAYGHVRARLRRERRGRPRRQPVNGGRISHAVISALMVGLASQAVFAADESTLSIRLTSPLGRIGTPGTVRVVAQLTTPPDAVLLPVRFFVDGALLDVDDEGPPFAVDWEDRNPFEPRVITVEVSDTAGQTARDSVTLEAHDIIEVSQVRSVLLEAAVYDRNHRFVHGLTPADFTLREDGLPESIDLVAKDTIPSTFGLLVDSSRSMSRAMPFVRQSAEKLTTYLRPDDRVIVAPFAHGLKTITGPTDDKATVSDAIATIEAGGGTAILDSLVELAQRLHRVPGRRAVILVTDGYDEDSDIAPEDALATLQDTQVAVYVVAIGGVAGIALDGKSLLRRLANETGGMAFFPRRAYELGRVYDVLATDAQNRYVIAYTPSNQTVDGMWRAISLESNADDYVLTGTRTGYFAPAPPPVRPSLEFTVTDTRGQYVAVSADDLVVLENGVEQSVATFQEAVTPVSIVLTLDSSGSMRQSTDSVIRAGKSFVESLRPDDALGMILFGDRPVFAHDLGTDRVRSFEAIDAYHASGGTALYDAVSEGLTRLRRESGRRAVVLVTDGRDEDNPGTGPGSLRSLEHVLGLLRETGAALFAVGIGPNVARTALELMARESGGQAYFPADVSGLRGDYDRIVENLRRRFVLSYTSTNAVRDGAWREVEISPVSSEFVAVSAGGYFAPVIDRRRSVD